MVELMTTVVVAAILIAIAVPNFNRMVQDARLERVQSELAASLSFARNTALTSKAVVTVCGRASEGADTCNLDSNNWKFGWLVLDANNQILMKSPSIPSTVGLRVVLQSGYFTSPSVRFSFVDQSVSAFSLATDFSKYFVACDSRGDKFIRWVSVPTSVTRYAVPPYPLDSTIGGAVYSSTKAAQLGALNASLSGTCQI